MPRTFNRPLDARLDEPLPEAIRRSHAEAIRQLQQYSAEDEAASGSSGTATALATTGSDVVVSTASPPSSGKVLTATSGTAATWQTPSAGGLTKWAIITMSGNEATLDESGPDLVTKLDTVSTGSTGHGITASAGAVTLPANTPGYKWRARYGAAITGTAAASDGAFSWTANPLGSPPVAAGFPALWEPMTYTGNTSGTELATAALHFVSGTGTLGIIIIATQGATTWTMLAAYCKAYIDEVPA